MPTPPLTELMDEMADTISDAVLPLVPTLQVLGRQNKNPTPPSIDIYPGNPFAENGATGFNSAIGAWIFTVRARVTSVSEEGGQDLLLTFMDDEHPHSIATALLDDQTLNGYASSVKVEGPSGFVDYPATSVQGSLLGCQWLVTVLRALS